MKRKQTGKSQSFKAGLSHSGMNGMQTRPGAWTRSTHLSRKLGGQTHSYLSVEAS